MPASVPRSRIPGQVFTVFAGRNAESPPEIFDERIGALEAVAVRNLGDRVLCCTQVSFRVLQPHGNQVVGEGHIQMLME